ncbi:uncharacterized protein LOC131438414 [Malaya genurostris]|uniref:uncharacterized protein LOC131438414 n=1 Tax=Malaya genurostris TaxID=325434 RepID=UPI0026F3E47F|nr:uncharacterized protein LOC131438414 [Malaya genurostris]XP_058464413.1 uncharacterized protein LOC131438414 [Malaya genurostris]XP_058464414.1 uncharacterized protein LOC131438414 [Malaya genurostris]
MIIFLYLVLVLAWALLIIVLKCKKARAKRLAELEEAAQPVHVVQIGSNLYDIMAIQHHHHHRSPYGTMYDCLGSGDHHVTGTGHARSTTTSVTHSNAAFVGDDGSVFPSGNIPPLEPPPSYDEVIRLPAYYPKVETFVPEMVVPPAEPPPPPTNDQLRDGEGGSQPVITTGGGRIKTISSVTSSTTNS